MKRVGHGGASALVRANTLASFDTALEIGVDMIEFDVRAGRGELVLAHTRLDLHRPSCPTLDAALRHLSSPRFAEVELNLDLKSPGSEPAVVDTIRRFGLEHRVLLSSQLPSVLHRIRELDPKLATGISVGGRVSRMVQRWGDWRDAVLDALAHKRFHALMAQHGLIDHGLVEAVKERRAEIYGWTANDHRSIARLCELAVDGVVTNDPRLFALDALALGKLDERAHGLGHELAAG